MIPSKTLKTLQSTKTLYQKDSPKMKKTQSNYVLSNKTQSQKLKTTGYRNDSIRLNNSINYLQENTKTFHSSLCIPFNLDETQNKNEMLIKNQLIIELNKKISQLELYNSGLQQANHQLQNDILILNQTIEQICNQLQKQKELFESQKSQINELQNNLSLKQQELQQQKNENFKLITVLKISKLKNGKENCPESTQYDYQEQINLLKEQIQKQKQSSSQTESILQNQIKTLTSYFSEFFLKTNSQKKQINQQQSSQNETDVFQLQFKNLEDELAKYDEKFQYFQQTLNKLTDKQINIVVENANLSNTKEISKLKQIIQIQKKQIELQQKTILNYHFEIQNLQTLLYKSEYESIAEFKRTSVKNNDQFITQEFENSPNDEIYHLNDSQSDIKPKCFLDSIQNTLQKFQVITEESTFRY
ncbi:unnamed protein product [Paramecium pentaurelia]|uniref:Uncharacterized protein n=1 Tax=Paramecium pentaurelia TaxID=43138 RepID=A0A8S1WK11_9CILI|nr:unnamed protein product [Paramecium pentaurelia]